MVSGYLKSQSSRMGNNRRSSAELLQQVIELEKEDLAIKAIVDEAKLCTVCCNSLRLM